MLKTVMQLETVTCPSCIRKIEGTVSKQKGVEEVEVKFNASKVVVVHNEDLISKSDLSTLVSKLGYVVLGVK